MSDQRGFRPHVREIVCHEPGSLLDLIGSIAGDLTPLELVELGSVYVNEERNLNPARHLKPGDVVRVHSSPRRFPVPRDLAGRIVEESDDRLVVEKPSGFPTEPTVDNFKENLVNALAELRGQAFHLVNALETESQGLVMLAKSTEARDRWKKAFAEGRIERRFAIYTETPVELGSFDGFEVLRCEERAGVTDVIAEGRSTWRCEGGFITTAFRSELVLTSARPAKMRETLAARGAAVIGDLKNGSPRKLVDVGTGRATLAIHAVSL